MEDDLHILRQSNDMQRSDGRHIALWCIESPDDENVLEQAVAYLNWQSRRGNVGTQ